MLHLARVPPGTRRIAVSRADVEPPFIGPSPLKALRLAKLIESKFEVFNSVSGINII